MALLIALLPFAVTLILARFAARRNDRKESQRAEPIAGVTANEAADPDDRVDLEQQQGVTGLRELLFPTAVVVVLIWIAVETLR